MVSNYGIVSSQKLVCIKSDFDEISLNWGFMSEYDVIITIVIVIVSIIKSQV